MESNKEHIHFWYALSILSFVLFSK